MCIVGEVLYLAFGEVKLDEREVNAHLQGAYIVGEVLYFAFGNVRLDEREVNSHR
ncbi:hypothetical protein [Pseudoalteromonas sp. GW168-MNA-CIBAN-0100]|uniref:hypothetical protein n=1 Tax=Pseudoalteromonas sp. GW168-MNA-CIBAN-0100 TaxID=3140434 RepID=UPI003317CFD2